MLGKFKAARRAAVPLVAIETADPQATIVAIKITRRGPADKEDRGASPSSREE